MGFDSDSMGFYSDFMGYEWDIPSGCVKIANWNMAIEIVSLSIMNDYFLNSYVKLPEGRHIVSDDIISYDKISTYLPACLPTYIYLSSDLSIHDHPCIYTSI